MTPMIVFGILCFIGGMNIGVLMSICIMGIEDKKVKKENKK